MSEPLAHSDDPLADPTPVRVDNDPASPVRRRRRLIGRGRPPRQRVGPSPVRAAFPNFFTLMNLLSGFFAILQTAQGNLDGAAWLIVLAAFFDLLDGMMARLAGVSSAFGLELDSLCDVVSFGVAPSFLVYAVGLDELGPLWGAVVASLPALCGAVRLARFNTYTEVGEKKDYFTGLPIPVQAGAVVAFILVFEDSSWFTGLERGRIQVLIPLVVVLSFLMVSPVRFPSLPQPNRVNLRKYRLRFAFFFASFVAALLFQEYGLFVVAVLYLGYGLLQGARYVVTAATDPIAEEGG